MYGIDAGWDPEGGRYGIPLAKHPEHKAIAKELKRLNAEAKRDHDEHLAAVMAVEYPREDDGCGGTVGKWGFEHAKSCLTLARYENETSAVIHDEAYRDRVRSRMAETRTLTAPLVQSGLYREPYTGSLSVRYDRVGKQAWEKELQRLGRK